MLAHAHHSAALGAFLAAQHLEALHHLDEGIKLLHGTEKHSELVRIELNSLAGNIFSDLGAFNLAVPFFTQVEELSRKVDRVHTIEYHYALLGLARARLELGDHQGCLEYINRASRWHDEFAEGTDNAQLFKAEADLFYGAVLAERGQKLELAGQFLLSAVTELTHVYTPGKHPLAEPYRRLGDYYRAAGFAQAAIDAYTDAEGCCSSCAIFSSTRRAVNQSLAELYSSDDPGMARVFASRAARIAQRNAIVVREQELTE